MANAQNWALTNYMKLNLIKERSYIQGGVNIVNND